MIWIYGHLKLAAAKIPPQPDTWLRVCKQELLRQSAFRFQREEPGILTLVVIHDERGSDLIIVSATAFTVGQLLNAERITLEWNEAGGIGNADGLLPVNTDLDASTGPFTLSVEHGPCDRYRPDGLLVSAIIHRGRYLTEFLSPGQFLFEALRASRPTS